VEVLERKFLAGDRSKTSRTRIVIVEESVPGGVKGRVRLTHFEGKVVRRGSADLDRRESGELTEVWGSRAPHEDWG
jgi:hypothetical protein